MTASSLAEDAQRQRAAQRRRVLLSTAIILLASLLVIIALTLAWHLSVADLISALIVGGVSWGLLITAIQAIRERLRLADLPRPLKARGGLGVMLFLLLFLILAFWGFAQAPGVVAPAWLGGIALVAVATIRWAKVALRPRFHIRIVNDGCTLVLNAGASLLESLRNRGYDLFVQCGGKGQCATCRVRVVEGPHGWGPAPQGILTPALLQENWVLACQVRVQNDMVIELFKPLVLGWPTLDTQPLPRPQPWAAAGFPQLSSRAQRLRHGLPGFDCAACGYDTCNAYAQAMAQGQASLDRCLPGGQPVLTRLQAEAQELHLVQVIPSHA